MKKKLAGLAILVVLLLLGLSTLVLKIQPVNAVSSDFNATVLYSDGYPVEGYWILVKDIGNGSVVGACCPTNETGQCETTFDPPLLGNWVYLAEAWEDGGSITPSGYFGAMGVYTDGNGNGEVTIYPDEPYEITPPFVEILSPQNKSYPTSSVPLNFTIDDYSPISWTGYSLDNQPNVTITGNTTLSSLTWGKHNTIVYANDTYGNMGSSNKIYFTRTSGCVVITVKYADGCPIEGAEVTLGPIGEPDYWLGYTNASGQIERCNLVNPGEYTANAYFPPPSYPWFQATFLLVDGNGNGNATITGSENEPIPPEITILSPQNMTYTTSSIPLTFIYDDYSEHSWYGYSLDNNPNVTISGNTTISVGLGQHNVIVYANDTYGNMGASDRVYFTRTYGCVTVTVLFADGSPVKGAQVIVLPGEYGFPDTNATGQTEHCGTIPPGEYAAKAYYPPPYYPLFQQTGFWVDENGTGSATIIGDYNKIDISYLVTVQYADGTPRPGADVFVVYPELCLGRTNETGQIGGTLDPGGYEIFALYPPGGPQFGTNVFLPVPGNATITANYGPPCVTVTVQYLDGYPRPGADVYIIEPEIYIGLTGDDGKATLCDYVDPGEYYLIAFYGGSQFGPDEVYLYVDEYGDGSTTITANYEITPPVIEILSPENMTYINTSLPLNFTIYDFSSISWISYSLDDQDNITISGNTTSTDLAIGPHTTVVYANDTYGNMGSSDKIYFTISTHDIAVTSVVPSKTVVGQGYSMSINVTVENQGDFSESFNVSVFYDNTIITLPDGKNHTTTTLTSGNSTTLTLTWNTTGVAKGNYTITAKATQLPYETDTTDNTLTDGWIIISLVGDVTGPEGWPDGIVEAMDLFAVAKCYGAEPPDPKYNPNYDINGDGIIEAQDLYTCARHYGETDP